MAAFWAFKCGLFESCQKFEKSTPFKVLRTHCFIDINQHSGINRMMDLETLRMLSVNSQPYIDVPRNLGGRDVNWKTSPNPPFPVRIRTKTSWSRIKSYHHTRQLFENKRVCRLRILQHITLQVELLRSWPRPTERANSDLDSQSPTVSMSLLHLRLSYKTIGIATSLNERTPFPCWHSICPIFFRKFLHGKMQSWRWQCYLFVY